MLRMDQVHVVRHKILVEGRSIRSVSRQMSISRNTIRKYLKVSEPVRVVRQKKPSPVMEMIAPRVEEILSEWRARTTAKQRITGTRIHRQLVEEGYQVGLTTVRSYLREKRRQQAEVFVPLIHRPGEEAQVDFFEVTVEEGGQRRKAWKFVMRLMYSGRDFIRLYDRQDQLSFLDAHVKAFGYLGGVPERIVYDNLSAAVKKIVGSERELTERFTALASHYLFEPCFTRPAEGHDKGGVEARGKGIRLAHLTPIPKERKGTQKVRYRHYLSELAKKPQAVRQVAPELIREMGGPYERMWEMLLDRYGAKEAARVLARILGAVVDHGEEPVADALTAALCNGRCDLLSLAEHLKDRRERISSVRVPERLSDYEVESANASDYDLLLGRKGEKA